MSTPVKVVAFVAGLAVLFGAGLGVGRVVGDRSAAAVPEYQWALTAVPGGTAGRETISFAVSDKEGAVLTRYAVRHEKQLHLVAVRKDFAEFRHVHPTMAADGTWSVEADLTPGPWRFYADFQPVGGEATVLDADVTLAGDYIPEGRSEVRRTVTVDGYTVTVRGDLVAGADAGLSFEITRDGAPVDVQPYLGASGHLVALRAEDLRYLHVHPEDAPSGPQVDFLAEVPSPGSYHLYLDFRHDDVVRTASFTLNAAVEEPRGEGGMDHGGH